MAKNDLMTYIFGDWSKFIGFVITSIISIIGVTFMGGSFLELAKVKHDTEKEEPSIEGGRDTTQFTLYYNFLKYVTALTFHNIDILITKISYYSAMLPKTFILFVLPVFISMSLPFIYPIILTITVLGLLYKWTSFDLKENNFTYLVIPPLYTFSSYCSICTQDITGYGMLSKIFYYMKYPFFVWLAFFISLAYSFMNMLTIGSIAGFGCLYFLWFIFIRPLHRTAEGVSDYHNYMNIIRVLQEYSTTLLIICSLIYFAGSTIYLGHPLRITATVIVIVSILWLFFEYIKNYKDT